MSPLLSVLAGRPPGPSDRPDRTTIAMEQVDDDPSLSALTASCHRLSAFQEGAQLGDEREDAAIGVLCRPGLVGPDAPMHRRSAAANVISPDARSGAPSPPGGPSCRSLP